MLRLGLNVVALLLAAVTMALALAHALEMPGKMRLSRETYFAVQRIYYPGFTWAGVSEPLAVLALIATLVLRPVGSAAFWLNATALAAAAATHAFYWLLTAPANKVWLKHERLSVGAERFFGTRDAQVDEREWTHWRDRWERSHLIRAATATSAFVLTALAALL